MRVPDSERSRSAMVTVLGNWEALLAVRSVDMEEEGVLRERYEMQKAAWPWQIDDQVQLRSSLEEKSSPTATYMHRGDGDECGALVDGG